MNTFISKKMNINFIFLRYFGLGNMLYAPGTFTSLSILCIWYFIPNNFIIQFLILLIHLIGGFYFCFRYELNEGEIKDPSYIVIDEVVGMMISLFLIPKTILAYSLAFILFRALDIFKPSIIYRSQNFGYGIGIMLDDIIAGIITLLIIIGVYL